MPEPVLKYDSPEYLSHYGMHRAPFLPNVETDMYYAEATRVQRLDILLHLAQYGDELLLVTGPLGIGKTTMLHQFMQRAHASWKICQVNAYPMMPEDQLLQHINKGFKLPNENMQLSSSVSNLKKRIDAMLASTQTIVLIVDNAHLLPKKTLAVLLDIANTRNLSQGSSLHTILFCEPVIKILLAAPELENLYLYGKRKLELPAMDEHNTGEYLRHRLSIAGMVAERFLTPATVNKIYKASDGVPLKINEAADQLLFETTPIIRRTSNIPQKNTADKKGYAFTVGIVAICVIVVILVFQQEINALFAKKSATPTPAETVQQRTEKLNLPTRPEPPLRPTPTLSTTSDRDLPAVTSTQQKASDARAQQPRTTTPTAETASTAPAQPGKTSTNVVVLANEGFAGSAAQPESNSLKTLPEASGISADKLKTEDWLLKQNPDFYTLQLVSGHHKTTVMNFIEKHRLTSNKLAYYYTHRNEKNWHNLVFGLYPDRQTAHKAINDLPSTLKDIKPWVRQLESIQIDIYRAQR